MSAFLKDVDLRKLEAAIIAAEKRTNGEIVVVIARQSSSWAGHRALFGALLAFAVALGSIPLVGVVHPSWLVLAGPTAGLLGYGLAGVSLLTRLLVDHSEQDSAVLRAAKLAFLEHGVHRTRGRSGVLLYISLRERRVQILADEGIHSVVGDTGWKRYADDMVAALKAKSVDALLAVVHEVSDLLSRSFPALADNPDELENTVRLAR